MTMPFESVTDRLKKIQDEIANATIRAGRALNDVELLAVSKTKPIELIQAAFAAGQMKFGENYVQEAVEKAELLPQPEWHLIGSLQTNKVKFLKNHFKMIQSVDRERLAIELNKELEKIRAHSATGLNFTNCEQDILIQVHVGDEATKQGAGFDEVPRLIEVINNCPNLRLRGLMSLPPQTADERIGRGYFASLREALETWTSCLQPEARRFFDTLSMGTSHDFEWAIQEGATMIRVGTAIFGSRGSAPSVDPG